MASNSDSSSNPHVFVLHSPHCGYEYAEIRTVLRNQVMLYDNAPHGYYITRDHQENQYLFPFASGADATKAFHEALIAQDLPKTKSTDDTAQFNPLPMRTGQQPPRSSDNSSASNYLSRMQSSRMAMPKNSTCTTPRLPSQYIQESDINSLLPLHGIDFGSKLPSRGQEVFYYLRADVNDTTPGLNELEFKLHINTGPCFRGGNEMADVAHEWSKGFEIQSKQPKLRPELRGNDRSSVGTIEIRMDRM
ncbi:hypothetical protein GGU11DRAFT_879859, partial [Lentinula aff. detonsa]